MVKENIFILHSLNADTLKMWANDVIANFENKLQVIAPQFPIRAESRYEKFDEILSKYLEDGTLNEESIVICHSIGNPYFIRFCREHNFSAKAYIAVAPGALYEYPSTRTDYIVEVKKQSYLKQPDFEYGKTMKNVYLFYSDEDDGNLEKFTRFEKDFGAKAFYLKGYYHFDGYHEIKQIPELIDLLNKITK
ncbi:MAG: hypothetical protein E7341_05705 [Clostridiales bacterium]|nr:hypothetical protein [Clostridiales bacterium]